MNIYVAISLCFLPFIVTFACFKIFSKVKFSTLLIASALGLAAVLPTTFLQFYFGFLVPDGYSSNPRQNIELFLKVLIFNGLIEELFKTILIALIPSKKLSLNQFFVSALICGLCLASFESAVYLLQNLQKANLRGGQIIYELIFTRIFTADLLHVFCAGLCGLFIWSVRNKKTDFFALIFAIFIHGAFNFFGYLDGNSKWFILIAVLFAIIECRIRYVKQLPEGVAGSDENETIIVFQQNEGPGEKHKKIDSAAVAITQTKPEDVSGFWKLDEIEGKKEECSQNGQKISRSKTEEKSKKSEIATESNAEKSKAKKR